MGNADISRKRRTLRLTGYDYSQTGAYFVTVCTHERCCLFGDIVDEEMQLNDAGAMIEMLWSEIPEHYPGVEIDVYQVMPNHLHAIVLLVGTGIEPGTEEERTTPRPSVPSSGLLSLANVVQYFKTLTTSRYIHGVRESGWRPFPGTMWQRSYYEHVIRNDEDMHRIRAYITGNPASWAMDNENPQRTQTK